MILILNLTELSDEPLHAQLSRQLRARSALLEAFQGGVCKLNR